MVSQYEAWVIEVAQKFEDVAEAMSNITGDEWIYDVDDWALVRGDGLGLSVWGYSQDAKVNLKAKVNFDHRKLLSYDLRNNPDMAKEISVTLRRPADALAKDIIRRILPSAEQIHPKVLECVHAYQEREERQAQRVAKYEKLLGDTARVDRGDRPKLNLLLNSPSFSIATVKPSGTGVTITVDWATEELAEELCLVLARYAKRD